MKLILRIIFRELGDVKELTDVLQNQFSSGAYTHHQKSVICDADPDVPGAARRLVAFVGGNFFLKTMCFFEEILYKKGFLKFFRS